MKRTRMYKIKFTRRDRPLGGRSVERVCYRGIIIEIELNDKNFSPVIFKRRFSAYPLIIKKFKKALSQKLIGRNCLQKRVLYCVNCP